jgi:hypothetical protein
MSGRDARHDVPYQESNHGEEEDLMSWETGDGVWDEQGSEGACVVSEAREALGRR